MKTSHLLLTASLATVGFTTMACAQKSTTTVPVTQTLTPAPASRETYNYEQRTYGTGGPIVATDKAAAVLDAFRIANDKLGKPRYLIYVNRDLVEGSGLKLSGRTEHVESTQTDTKSTFEADPNAPKPAIDATAVNPTPADPNAAPATPQPPQVNVTVVGGNSSSGAQVTSPGKGTVDNKDSKVSSDNTYTSGNKTAPTIADKQTTREVERLLGRPLRYAGATLADQKTAAALIADRPIDHFTAPTDDAARKDREALAKVADIVIEALVTSRNTTVVGVAGDETVSVPDIQLTAIRLSDSAVLGQASSGDVLGKDQQAGMLAKKYDIRDITEATALALLEDITVTTK